MANICFFDMEVLGKKENIDRLIEIMKYNDPVFYICRVREVYVEHEDDFKDVHHVQLMGEAAWSLYDWYDHTMEIDSRDGTLCTNLIFLSEHLHLSIEVFGECDEDGFNQHMAFKNGEVLVHEACDKTEPWYEVGNDTIDDVIEEIKEDAEEWDLSDDEMRSLVEEVTPILEKYKEVSVKFGGYDWDYDLERLYKGECIPWKIEKYCVIS